MVSALPSEHKGKGKNRGHGGTSYNTPDIRLIDQEQWAYIRRRYHLSPRELQVVKLVCEGLTNNDIAQCLKIRLPTVKTYLQGIFGKTGVRNKVTLLLRLIDDVNAFSYESRAVPPIPIVEVDKPGRKVTPPVKTPEKES